MILGVNQICERPDVVRTDWDCVSTESSHTKPALVTGNRLTATSRHSPNMARAVG